MRRFILVALRLAMRNPSFMAGVFCGWGMAATAVIAAVLYAASALMTLLPHIMISPQPPHQT